MLPLHDNVIPRRYPRVMVTLIAVNVLVFLYEITLGEKGLYLLFLHYGITPAAFTAPSQVGHACSAGAITLITSLFLHGGWLHLLGNIWYLWLFGDNVEDRMGHGRFLLFYLLGGVAAGALHILLNPHSTDPCVGASGAIAAVLGAYLVLYPRARIITLAPIYFIPSIVRPPAIVVLGFWFVVQLFSGMGSLVASAAKAGDIAYWAHVGGFLFGMAALTLFRERK